MKNRLLILLAFSFLFLVSCKKKENPTKSNNPANTSSNSFKLKKEGVPYSATHVSVSLIDDDVLGFEAWAVLNQVHNNTYAGFIRRSIQPGTYALETGESGYFSLFHIQDEHTMFGWSHGSLTVLSNDTVSKVMHCNFEIHLYNDEIDQYPHVTDGEMTLHY
ncbi:hypothetical protein D3C87_200540 [compost metagenome]